MIRRADKDEIEDRVSIEFGKIKGNIKKLTELLQRDPLDRESCKFTLIEIMGSLVIISSFAASKLGKSYCDTLAPLIKDSINFYEQLISKLDSPLFNDKEVKNHVHEFMKGLEVTLAFIESQLGLKYGILKISELITKFPMFTENWAVAVIYLSAMEVMVNIVAEKLGLSPGKDFKDKCKGVLEEIRRRGVEVPELEVRLPPILWDIRNKVVHARYSPTDDELKIITDYVGKVLKTLDNFI